MAKRRPRRRRKKSNRLPWLALVAGCLVAGVILAIIFGGGGGSVAQDTANRWSKDHRTPVESSELNQMTRAQLEAEVLRLQARLEASERELADLLIQMELSEASATAP